MAKQKRERLERIVSPIGIARYPHLDKPDEYKGDVKYKCDLVLDPSNDEDSEFLDDLKARAEDAFERFQTELQEKVDNKELKGKKLADAKKELKAMEVQYPFEPEYDDEGEETGRYVVKSKSKAQFTDKKTGETRTKRLPAFDSNGKRMDKVPAIWGGSELRLSFDVYPYHMEANSIAGISLLIAGVQIIELKTGGGASAEDLGFGAVEGGFAADGQVDEASAEEDDFEDDDEDDF